MRAKPDHQIGIEIPAQRTLDCRGLRCPLPVIYTRKTLALMPSGELLIVIATDPGSAVDFAEYGRRGGLDLVAHRENSGDHIFLVRKP